MTTQARAAIPLTPASRRDFWRGVWRVADPALFLAPLMHHFGWKADDWHRMGQGIVVGHLLGVLSSSRLD